MFNYTYSSAGVCFMYPSNMFLLLIMKPPSRISNFKTGGGGGESAWSSRKIHQFVPFITLKLFLIIIGTGKISCKAILVPKQRFMKACRSVEERKL